MSILLQELGKRLKSARKMINLTQQQIAEKINLSRQYIIEIEKGQAENVSFNIILIYLDACKVNWGDFFADLNRIIERINHEKILDEIGLSSATGLNLIQKRKIDRDIAYFRMRIDSRRGKAKSLSRQQKNKAAVEFGKHWIAIEPIEAEIQKKLGELGVPIVSNQGYKDFARECYSVFKKYSTYVCKKHFHKSNCPFAMSEYVLKC